MGMYTELVIGIRLKEDTPTEVLAALEHMTSSYESDYKPNINHPLFNTDRWHFMLRSIGSYYFDGKPSTHFEFDNIANCFYLTVRSNIKNYDHEYENFLDWIKPYSDTKGFVGYTRYEEDEKPTLIYF